MQPRPANETLRGRILGELTRIIRGWVMLSVGVVGALAVGAGTYDASSSPRSCEPTSTTRHASCNRWRNRRWCGRA
jgi:hypothetical protein